MSNAQYLASLVNSSGNIVVPVSNGGVVFNPSTTGTGTVSSNTMSDYETGTWTPVLTSTSGTVTSTSNASGTYTKIGREVFLWGTITLTNPGTASGNGRVSGLPFAAYNNGLSVASDFNVREDGLTGNVYQGILGGNNSIFSMQTLTGGNITWTTNYVFTWAFIYQASF